MSTKSSTPAYFSTEDIVIERREEIGRVHVSPDRTVSAMEAAFGIATHYVAEETTSYGGVSVEFAFGSHVWTVGSRLVTPTA
jgi:hypothetical protein